VAIGLPGPDRLLPGPLRDFVEALHALYDSAGRPGARVISRGIRHDQRLHETVSHETVSSTLRGVSLPSWAKVQSIIVELARESIDDHDKAELMRRYQPLWLAARSSLSLRDKPASPPMPPIPPMSVIPAGTFVQSAPMVAPAVAAAPEFLAQATSAARRGFAFIDEPPADRPAEHPDIDERSPPPSRAVRLPTRGDHETRVVAGTAVEVSPAPQPPASPDGPIIGWLPDQNPSFVGREILLDTMSMGLMEHPNSPLVLYGPGGTGKTQLAREYVGKFADAYALIWWVPADQLDRARASLLVLAERLLVPPQYGAEQTIASLLGRLESQQRNYLLVFDAAEDDDIRSLIPTIGGHVIVTTRNPGLAHDSTSTDLEVPDFDSSEAIQFLRRRDPQLSGIQSEQIVQKLGRSPLALEQVAALRAATDEPWETLLTRLEEPGQGLLSSGHPSHYPHTVAASVQLAMDQLRSAYPPALLVFELFAWFGAEPVSILLLRAGRTANVPPALSRALRDTIALRKAIGEMCRYGLVRLDADAQRTEIQPLMRLALRDAMDPDAQQRAQQNVHEILAAADPGYPDGLPSSEMHREMAAHVVPAGLVQSRLTAAQWAVIHQIRYRCLIGDFENACQLGEIAVTTWRDEAFLGADHERVLVASGEWANALRAIGRYEQSRLLTEDAMRRLAANPEFGPDHPHTLWMASGYAADLRIAGAYEGALRLSEETFRRRVVRAGLSDHRTISSRHNLAVSLRLVGKFQEALELDEDELSRRRAAPGDHSFQALPAAYAVAEDTYGLGRYAETIELLSPYLEHGGRVDSTNYGVLAGRLVALAHRALGRLTEAADSLRDHYHNCIEAFGPDHEHTLAATMSYANALRQRGRSVEAYGYAADAVNTYRRLFGMDNPLTLAAEINLAAIRRANGELTGSRQADTVASDALRRAVGDRHPFTIVALINLASDLALANDRQGAVALSVQAHAAALAVRGPSHPDTLAAAGNLALDYQVTGSSSLAETLLTKTLASLRRTFGRTHPTILQVASGVRVDVDIEPSST
jgi:tetratricopeptide (TPR) repeat protein